MKRTEAVCSQPDCIGRVHGRGMCSKHYMRWQRGSALPSAADPVTRSTRTCSVDGCTLPHRRNGYCEAHYARWRRHGDPLGGGQSISRTVERLPATPEHFWPRVDRSSGPDACWPWLGFIDPQGYGRASCHAIRGYAQAHRVAYLYTHEDLPPSPIQLDHLCRNRACVNPSHLEPVSPRENTLRSEAPSAAFAKRTHCGRGHELAGSNLYVRKDGSRQCRRCHADYQRAWRAAS